VKPIFEKQRRCIAAPGRKKLMHHALSRRLALALLLAPFAACGNADDPVDLGHDGPSHALGSALSDYAGTWQGRTEAFEFSDGSDTVTIEIAANGSGELRLGDTPELPPPDPSHGYPPNDAETYPGKPLQGVAPGFAYPIADAVVGENRIRMHSSSGELYREWCDLMTPHLVTNATPTYYACLPFAGFGTTDNKGECTNGENLDQLIDCGLTLCLSMCECSQDDCHVNEGFVQPDIQIDARLEDDGDSFVGTLVLGSERITVLLTRM
jgi:hypothetical protein